MTTTETGTDVRSETGGLSRNQRRKAATRAKLIEAARRVMGRKGFESTKIRDITDEADVGFGSFYNYFDSKEAICEAALADILTELSEIIDLSNGGVESGVERIANAIGNFLRRARLDPVMSLFILQVGTFRQDLARNITRSLVRDVNLGIEQDALLVSDMRTLIVMVSGALFGFLRERLLGDLTPEDDEHAVHIVLRMVGASEEEAKRLSREFRRTPLKKT